jgi:hypothetical protein
LREGGRKREREKEEGGRKKGINTFMKVFFVKISL